MTATLALVGGRVVDPATQLDAVRNVVVTGSRVSAVTDEPVTDAANHVDVAGLVVAPGFRISTEAYPYGSGMTGIGAAPGTTDPE